VWIAGIISGRWPYEHLACQSSKNRHRSLDLFPAP
jgi:hypothetical protein